MHIATRVVLGIAFGSLSVPSLTTAQTVAKPQGQIAGTAPGSKIGSLQQKTFEILCRGGEMLRVDPVGDGRHALYFQMSKKLPGTYGAGLDPGECSLLDRLFTAEEPPGIRFADIAGEQSVTAHRADQNRYWRFDVVKTNYGYFEARSYQRVLAVNELAHGAEIAKKPEAAKKTGEVQEAVGGASAKRGDTVQLNPQPLPPKDALRTRQPVEKAGLKPAPAASAASPATAASTAGAPTNLFEMDDRAIIIVGGKKTTAGDAKRVIDDEFRQSAKPPQTVSVRARQAPPNLPNANVPLSSVSDPKGHAAQQIQGQASVGESAAFQVDCRNYGPRITRVRGHLSPGETLGIDGWCFGSAAGTIELLGEFPDGAPRLVSEWTDTGITAVMPSVRRAAKQRATLTVIRASDRRRSKAVQVVFEPIYDRVDVPASYWSPTASFHQTSSKKSKTGITALGTPRLDTAHPGGGATQFRVTVNPACILDSMEAISTEGSVRGIFDWEKGTADHERRVTVSWFPRCVNEKEKVLGGLSSSFKQWCRVAFELRASAYCPSGIAP